MVSYALPILAESFGGVYASTVVNSANQNKQNIIASEGGSLLSSFVSSVGDLYAKTSVPLATLSFLKSGYSTMEEYKMSPEYSSFIDSMLNDGSTDYHLGTDLVNSYFDGLSTRLEQVSVSSPSVEELGDLSNLSLSEIFSKQFMLSTKMTAYSINSLVKEIALLNGTVIRLAGDSERRLSNEQTALELKSYGLNYLSYLQSIALGISSIASSLSSKVDLTALNTSIKEVSASVDKVSESIKGVGDVSLSIDELVRLKAVDNEQVKEHYALREGEIELNKESMEYAKTAQTVQDLDGKTIASFAPREASLVKDVTLAKDTTDKINFDIDDLIDEPNMPIIDLGGYPLTSDIMEELIQKLRGS